MMEIDRLLEVMAKLRDPHAGCPWDRDQTFATIVPYTIEEAYEVAEAIEQGDMRELKDELGDLLFQVVFYAQMGREQGLFDFQGIAAGVADKMVRRHPHVFGDVTVDSAEAQTVAWEQHKATERRERLAARGAPRGGVLDGVSRTLPGLTRAVKLQKRAARVGFDWNDASGVLDKVAEEADELRGALWQGAGREELIDELGDLLFTCANLARHLAVDPEAALRRANRKFERRFRRMEGLLAAQGRAPADVGLQELDRLWEEVKRSEREVP